MKVAPASSWSFCHEAKTWMFVISPALVHWKSSATTFCKVALTSSPKPRSGYCTHLLVAAALPVPPDVPDCVVVRANARSRLRWLPVVLFGSYSSFQLVPAGLMLVPLQSVIAHT